MKIKFHYSRSFPNNGGEININTRSNHLYFKKEPGFDISEVPKEMREIFYLKRVELSDEIKELISDTFYKNNIWDWPKDYNEALGYGRIMDGDLWELRATYKEKKVYSYGQVYYPDGYVNLIGMFSKIFNVNFYDEISENN